MYRSSKYIVVRNGLGKVRKVEFVEVPMMKTLI